MQLLQYIFEFHKNIALLEPVVPKKVQTESDRYAALADLDNTLRTLSFNPTTPDTNPFAPGNVSR